MFETGEKWRRKGSERPVGGERREAEQGNEVGERRMRLDGGGRVYRVGGKDYLGLGTTDGGNIEAMKARESVGT